MSPRSSRCPQCQVLLSDAAATCPACGVDLSEAQPAIARNQPRRAWISSLILLVLAGAMLAFAGVRLAPYWPRDLGQKKPADLPASVPTASEPLFSPEAVVSRLVLAPAGRATGQAVLGLGRPEYPEELTLAAGKALFPYEVMRQAVFEAARTTCGITTRDETLGDLLPDGESTTSGFVAGRFELGHRPAIIVGRGDPTSGKLLATVELGQKDVPNLIYVQLVEMAETAARLELPRVLKQLGLTARPVVEHPTAAVPDEIEDRLARLTCAEQFAAVRALHQLIRKDGESPERLGALARGYSHLGVLTEFHWRSSHHAYKARALLLAQRMVARDAKSALAFWHRAYARALAGYHQGAINDLAKARELGSAGSSPAWVALIDAFCHFRTDTLRGANSGQKAELAMLLAFLTNEQSICRARPIELGRAVLADNPECYRVADALCGFGGVSNLHTATVAPIQAFSQKMPARLAQLPGLPAKTAELLRNDQSERDVVLSLREAGQWPYDGDELSWAVLSRMLQEIRFAQVCRRLNFMRFSWGVPVDDELHNLRPLVADHPYRAAVECFAVDPQHERAKFAKLIEQVKIPDIEYSASSYLYNLWLFDESLGKKASQRAVNHTYGGYREVALRLTNLQDDEARRFTVRLRQMSPFSAFARAKMIELSWDKVAARAREWEAAAVDQPDVLFSLGRRYAKEGKWADAERCLAAALKLSPDRECYELLATSYRQQGHRDRWKETLDEFLKQPDYGLDHARVRVDIAEYFIGQQEYEKAQPYAEAAAQSWANWAMDCAVRCYEGLKNWERSEFWVRRISERYPNSWAAWFLWCKRLGRGDVETARALALQHVLAVEDRASGEELEIFGCFLALGGQTSEAIETLQKVDTGPLAVGSLLYAALLADDQNDKALREKLLNRVCDDLQSQAPLTVQTSRLFREALASDKPLDLEAVNRILIEYPAQDRGNLEFFVGRFLMRHGSSDDAKIHLRSCGSSAGTYLWFRITALDLLRQLEEQHH